MHCSNSLSQIQHTIAENAETPFVETQAIDSTCLRINHRNQFLIPNSERNTPKSGFRNEASMGLS